MRCKSILLCIVINIVIITFSYSQPSHGGISLLIRCDDVGMCHTVNSSFEEVARLNFPVSASVMFVCPWYQEAVEMLKKYPNVSVGVHLTLNSEWKNYRWGPAAGAGTVPSLVDSSGYFFPSRALLFAHSPVLREVELELRAQIERAMESGLRIDYFDYHMGAAVDNLPMRMIVEKLAGEYGVAISRYFHEQAIEGFYMTPPSHKLDTLLSRVSALKESQINLLVSHIGWDTPEMNAMIDQNVSGLAEMSKYRSAELLAIISEQFHRLLKEKAIMLISYRDLKEHPGVTGMQRPE
jgi:predicted glycoside hydrolase/deacetylase ChbG (UPF0249 family)